MTPGEGVHDWSDKVCLDSHVDFEVCQEPNGEHECCNKDPHLYEDHSCACGFEWADVVSGIGIHDPRAEWYTCVLDNGEHECWRRVHHDRPHGCACGFEWERTAEDEW